VDKVIERLKVEFSSEEARYAYADSVTNAFVIGQIKELREARKLTQDQLADLVGTQQSGISRWLNSGFSSCKVETLRKFARAFGVRLKISFEEFGSLPTDVRAFTKERLAPCKFEDDPAFREEISEPKDDLVAKLQPVSLAGLTRSPEQQVPLGKWASSGEQRAAVTNRNLTLIQGWRTSAANQTANAAILLNEDTSKPKRKWSARHEAQPQGKGHHARR
jgi:transcriptional regulator with XRE-family HTH domain